MIWLNRTGADIWVGCRAANNLGAQAHRTMRDHVEEVIVEEVAVEEVAQES